MGERGWRYAGARQRDFNGQSPETEKPFRRPHNGKLSCRPLEPVSRKLITLSGRACGFRMEQTSHRDGHLEGSPVLLEPSIDPPGGQLERNVKPGLCRASQHQCHREPYGPTSITCRYAPVPERRFGAGQPMTISPFNPLVPTHPQKPSRNGDSVPALYTHSILSLPNAPRHRAVTGIVFLHHVPTQLAQFSFISAPHCVHWPVRGHRRLNEELSSRPQ